MPLNSVNTNIAAQVALQSLNTTTSQLQATQKQISTGYRVADATDDGAAFAVAQRVRGDVSALTTVNQQLGNAQGLVGTALSGLTTISNYLTSAKSLLVDIGDTSVSAKSALINTLLRISLSSRKSRTQPMVRRITARRFWERPPVPWPEPRLRSSTTRPGRKARSPPKIRADLANTLATFIGSTFTRTTAGVDTFGAITAGARPDICSDRAVRDNRRDSVRHCPDDRLQSVEPGGSRLELPFGNDLFQLPRRSTA